MKKKKKLMMIGVLWLISMTLLASMYVWMDDQSLADGGTEEASSAPYPEPAPRHLTWATPIFLNQAPIGAAAGIAKDGDKKWHAIITDNKGYVICSQLPSPQAHFHPTHTQSENEEIRERGK